MKNRTEPLAFERALNCFTSYLLPPRACFFIVHDEVLVVNALQIEMKGTAVNCRLPHQTGVTERSIGGYDRGSTDDILHHVVIGHKANRIGCRFPVAFNRQQYVSISHKCGIARLGVRGVSEWIKHPLKMILARKPGSGQQRQHDYYQDCLAPPRAGGMPKPGYENQRGY